MITAYMYVTDGFMSKEMFYWYRIIRWWCYINTIMCV